jgi:branched-chain amino acid transport system permease protein
MFLQLLVNSLIAGAIYALVASGFSLIYTTNKFIHFAHGSIVVAGGYLLFLFFNLIHIPFYISCLLSIIFSAYIGYLINLLVYSNLRKRRSSSSILLIASISVLIFIESLMLIAFGADVKTIGFIKITKGIEFLGAIITPLQITIIGVSVVLLILLLLFMKKTKLGKALRAVSDNKDLSEVLGISSKKIYSLSFIIGSAIAGIAGILVALEQNLEPYIGTNLIIKGFTGAVIGGINYVPGSIVGAFLLGIAENFGIWYLPSSYKDAIAFILLFIFLLFRPQGIFGIKKGIKE